MEINIEKYLTDEEIKTIITDEVKKTVRNIIGSNERSFVIQFAKQRSKNEIEELIPNFADLLNSHIKDTIKSLTISDIFYKSLGWSTVGNKLFNKFFNENPNLVENKLKEIFSTTNT